MSKAELLIFILKWLSPLTKFNQNILISFPFFKNEKLKFRTVFVLAWNRDLYEKIGFEECIKRFVVSGTLHCTWDDTVAIIFEFRGVKLRGKM